MTKGNGSSDSEGLSGNQLQPKSSGFELSDGDIQKIVLALHAK
jgi:hypothetical protein